MRILPILAVSLGVAATHAAAEPKKVHFSPSAVVVMSVATPLQSTPEGLWGILSDGIRMPQFDDCTTNEWFERFELSRRAMVEKARLLGMEADALDKTLGAILARDPNALLPVTAIRAKLDEKEVWIVYLNWEWKPAPPKVVIREDGPEFIWDEPLQLSHIRIYAFTVETLTQVGFNTCG